MKTDTLKAIRKLLQTMRHRDQIPAVQALAAQFVTDDMVQDLDHDIRHAGLPVRFVYETFGYVLIGQGGAAHPVVDPGLDGVIFANHVFANVVAAPAVMRASDWGKSPNAIRNDLARAAEWAEPHCQALATAIRAISISKEGRPSYAGDIEVNVF